MNFAFLKIRVFRKNFVLYTAVLTIICLTLFIVIVVSIFVGGVNSHSEKSNAYFSDVEKQIKKYDKSLESYVQSVYSNSALLSEFLYYFGNTAEEYYSKKLMYSDSLNLNVSFVDDLKRFMLQQNGIVRQVNFISGSSVNSVFLQSTGHINYRFDMPIEEYSDEQKLPQYYHIYEKDLPLPSNYMRKMGTIQFIIDVAPILYSADTGSGNDGKIEYAYAVNGNNVFDILGNGSKHFEQIGFLNQADFKMNGRVRASGINYIYYNANTSSLYNFLLITGTDSLTVIKRNALSFLLLFLAFAIFDLLMSFIIGARMNVDARYIESIIEYINNFKSGNFNQGKLVERNDEYSMIANSLNDMSDEIKRYIEQQYLFKLKQQKAQMKALENQINPHFLYNTLEIIRSKAYLNGDHVVANAIYNLGSMYRNIVKGNTIITIREEIEMLKKYLSLMEFKYNDNFLYQIDIPDDMLQLQTVKFWMQPIVENFLEHGFSKDNQFNVILIVGEISEDYYSIRFIDNGRNISEEKLSMLNNQFSIENENISNEHVGLRNVYLRLRYFYGSGFCMRILNNDEQGVTVEVVLDKSRRGVYSV